jgi:hypothetical protein
MRLSSRNPKSSPVALLFTLNSSPYYSIRSRQHVRRNCQADLAELTNRFEKVLHTVFPDFASHRGAHFTRSAVMNAIVNSSID